MIFLLWAPLSWDLRHAPAVAFNPNSLENLQENGKVNEGQEGEEGAQVAEQAGKRPGVDSTPFTSVRCMEMCCSGQGVTAGGCAVRENSCRSGRKLFPSPGGRWRCGSNALLLAKKEHRSDPKTQRSEVTQRPKYQKPPPPSQGGANDKL